MKGSHTIRLALLVLGLPLLASCELVNTGPDGDDVPYNPAQFVVVDEMPELIGGLPALQRQLQYTEEARQAGIEGRVFVQFFVNELGYAQDAAVTRGLGYGLDEECLRVLKKARFYPGRAGDHFAKVKMSLPLTFKL